MVWSNLNLRYVEDDNHQDYQDDTNTWIINIDRADHNYFYKQTKRSRVNLWELFSYLFGIFPRFMFSSICIPSKS